VFLREQEQPALSSQYCKNFLFAAGFAAPDRSRRNMGRGLVGAAGDRVKLSLGEFASLCGIIQISDRRGVPIIRAVASHDPSPRVQPDATTASAIDE
jgi:hypothetical protein